MKFIDIETEIKMHGYDPVEQIITPSKEIIDFATFIEDLDIPSKKLYLGPSTKEEALNNAKSFFNSKFKLQKVPYRGDLRTKLDTPLLRYIPSQDLSLKVYNSLITYKNPFNLPISFTSQDFTDCMVVEHATFIDNDDFLKKMKITYREIILSKQITELTESSYVHEITHTQLAHLKGIIRNFFNREVLSIFLELLNIFESPKSKTLLPLQDAIRLTELYEELYMLEEQSKKVKTFDEEELIKASTYSESIIKAYGLFIEYLHGSTSLKKYILNSIQYIFNGELVLEELLEEFELNTKRIVQDERVLKYFKR